MNLKIKNLGISTGGPFVAVMNQSDARKLDLRPMDRIKIRIGSRLETVVLDVADDAIKEGYLGLMQELFQSLAKLHLLYCLYRCF